MMTIAKYFKEEEDFLYRVGQEKGIEKGRYQEAIEIARELKKEGLAFDFIAKTTKLTLEDIEELEVL